MNPRKNSKEWWLQLDLKNENCDPLSCKKCLLSQWMEKNGYDQNFCKGYLPDFQAYLREGGK